MYGYEQRPSQVEMAAGVRQAILEHKHALIEAPTGTGKSIAYLVPAILSGKTVVVSTANKSLQSQLFQKDIPFLRQVLGREIRAVVVKGRSNYVCNLKWEKELAEQKYISLYDREDDQVKFMRTWLDETETGDVDELPFVLGSDLRPRVVSFPDDCLHGDCRHDEDNCWVNFMRDAAAEAQVIITNHHLLLNALELGFAGERILPPASVYVIDEAHHLEQIATCRLRDGRHRLHGRTAADPDHAQGARADEEIEQLRYLNTLAFQEVSNQSRDNAFQVQGELESMRQLGSALGKLGQRLKQANPYAAEVEQAAPARRAPAEDVAEKNRYYELAVETVNSAATKLSTVATNRYDDKMVRYAVRLFERRYISIEAARRAHRPGEPAEPISLSARRTTRASPSTARSSAPARRWRPTAVSCTSRRAAASPKPGSSACCRRSSTTRSRRCSTSRRCRPTTTRPPMPTTMPWPPKSSGCSKSAAGAPSACSPTGAGCSRSTNACRLRRAAVIWPVRAQGDAPRDALLAWFKETPHSVLLATRSFWEGVDIPGDDLSLVVLDKMPFPTPGDPLHGARMRAIEQEGRSSFGEYMAPADDLGAQAGLWPPDPPQQRPRRGGDPRRTAEQQGLWAPRTPGSAACALQPRLQGRASLLSRSEREGHPEFALNVWATQKMPASGSGMAWRWQLVRLQDGRADSGDGVQYPAPDPAAAEIHAIQQGLSDLRRRIERGGHVANRYSVEIRCSAATAAQLTGSPGAAPLPPTWEAEQAHWKALIFAPVRD